VSPNNAADIAPSPLADFRVLGVGGGVGSVFAGRFRWLPVEIGL
jgi:hypothetical protein